MNSLVKYEKNKTIEEIVPTLKEVKSPHIFLWYIGAYGLKKQGVEFYRDCVITPIARDIFSPLFWLVDLTAWGAFKNPQLSISSFNSICTSLENFPDPRVKCSRSSDFFSRIQEINHPAFIKYFKSALNKEFLTRPSKNMPDTGKKLGEIFNYQCDVISDFFEMDSSKAYSIIQYLEAFFLIERAILFHLNEEIDGDIQVNFILPNDEIKYYEDDSNSFQRDLCFFLDLFFKNVFEIRKIHVNFFSFQYGQIEHHRPYNSPGKVIKKAAFKFDDVLDIQLAAQREDHEFAQIF